MSTQILRRSLRLAEAALTPHGVDRYVELALPTWSSTEVRARVIAVRRATPSSVTLTLRPNARWQGFRAGQYTQLTVEIDGVRHTRCYSLAGSQHGPADRIELTVKAHPDGTASRYLFESAAPGMVVGLSPALGEFTLPSERPSRLLLISGGSGITPVMSMLRTLCDEGYSGPITFLHYALTADEHAYRDEVDELAARHPNVHPVRVYTDAPGTGDLDGFFTPDQLAAADPKWAEAETYVCGPAPLMDSVRAHYQAAGADDRYHDEAFTLAELAAEATGGTVLFAASDAIVTDDGRPLLVQAEAAGLSPENGCRMGICHTCTRQLVCGTVRDVTSGDLTSEPGAEIRLCVNAPVGDVTIDV